MGLCHSHKLADKIHLHRHFSSSGGHHHNKNSGPDVTEPKLVHVPDSSLSLPQQILDVIEKHPVFYTMPEEKSGLVQQTWMHQQGSEPHKISYFGEVKDGRPHGRGEAFYHTKGEYWIGDSVDGRPHGDVQVYYLSGEYFIGKAHEGSIIEGRKYNRRGDVYEGTFNNGLRHGKGTIHMSTGDKVKATFEDGNMQPGAYMINKDGTITHFDHSSSPQA